MPWRTDSLMSQRLEFIEAVLHRTPGQSIRELCRSVGISERVGHKWLKRFGEGGPAALADRSHAPHQPAHQVPREVSDRLCALREEQPTWGARKLRDVLQREDPTVHWPAPSTITTLLDRAGLLTRRRRSLRERSAWAAGTLTAPTAPNEVWAADFKGEFRLRDGTWCYPLTLSDLHSRYVVGVRALASTAGEPTTAAIRAYFAEFGLPRVIRTDNGIPFGAPLALGGLSPLAVWWIRLGIRPERIQKGVPQQNGTHERMHRTLKAEATRPASASLAAQQQRFDRWRQTFNNRRPHEAHANTPPAHYYAPSPRSLPHRLPLLEYASTAELRRVSPNGFLKWRTAPIFLSTVLGGEYVAFEETANDEWTIRFGPLVLGVYSATLFAFTEHLNWSPERP
jgi:putative transposase